MRGLDHQKSAGRQAAIFGLTANHKRGRLDYIMRKSSNGIFMMALALVLAFSTLAVAQMSDRAELDRNTRTSGLGVPAAANPFSLIDLSRIKWSHSYSVSYFSGGGADGSGGLWQTSMYYEFSPKLSLNFNLGVAHTGNLLSNSDRQAAFLPGFTLDYHPSDKFRVSLMFQTYRGFNGPNVSRSSLWHNQMRP
jgi:hypothetical protein